MLTNLFKTNMAITLPAEWSPQSGTQLTWPHEDTDWAGTLEDVIPVFVRIATEIAKRQKLLVACADIDTARKALAAANLANIRFYETPSNDTWARDHGPITVFEDSKPVLLDFFFNGWGLKFAACFDNQITTVLHGKRAYGNIPRREFNFVLEGGAIESDGAGTILTTASCQLSPNRNPAYSKEQTEALLKEYFGAKKVLWLHHGQLEGDDTDGHVDTLARFCPDNVIAYVKSPGSHIPEHYALEAMEAELRDMTDAGGKPFRLMPLPVPSLGPGPVGERMPATYANFLIVNGAVLVPVYGAKEDEEALDAVAQCFPGREIVGINCLPLVRQGGSLHCLAMHFPEKVLGY